MSHTQFELVNLVHVFPPKHMSSLLCIPDLGFTPHARGAGDFSTGIKGIIAPALTGAVNSDRSMDFPRLQKPPPNSPLGPKQQEVWRHQGRQAATGPKRCAMVNNAAIIQDLSGSASSASARRLREGSLA
jgi:hypothetical protein